MIGSPEGDDGELFGRISDIVVGPHGEVYVADLGYQRVQKYDSTGQHVGVVGGQGEGPGLYYDPCAVALDSKANVYVASRGRISIFDGHGVFVQELRTNLSGFVRKIRVNTDNVVFVSCFDLMSQQIVHRFPLTDGTRGGSFCDSYAVDSDEDTREEMMIAGGSIDIRNDGTILYTQMTPYEIRLFSPEGVLLSAIYRANDFMTPPRVEYLPGGGVTLHAYPMSVSIIVLGDGRFVNAVIRPVSAEESETILDVYEGAGVLIGTTRLAGALGLKCRDERGRLYASERGDFPKVVKYKVHFEGGRK
ncbi:MAG TPA: hypothetical protein VEC56_00595 [Candidatus Krumholzibacteria bacterium]|nr:hypothetical protein [Candidatus Krumholzibacteria bacterium]